jgi:putative membrane protein
MMNSVIDWDAFGLGALSFALAFVAAGGFTLIFKAVYQVITPHNEGALIRQGNIAAAIALGGAVIGYVIPLTSALAHTESLPEFVVWALLAGVFQISAFWIVRQLAFRDLSARIEAGDVATALYLLMISLAVGLLNAACMTT